LPYPPLRCFQSGSTPTSPTTLLHRTAITPLTSCLTPRVHFKLYLSSLCAPTAWIGIKRRIVTASFYSVFSASRRLGGEYAFSRECLFGKPVALLDVIREQTRPSTRRFNAVQPASKAAQLIFIIVGVPLVAVAGGIIEGALETACDLVLSGLWSWLKRLSRIVFSAVSASRR